MTTPVDYSVVIADLESKRDQLNSTIAVLRALASGTGIEGLPSAIPASTANSENGEQPAPTTAPLRTATAGIRNDTFFKLGTAAAIRKYLGIVKRTQTPRAIADALREGGQVHAVDPKTAYLNVYSALKRGKEFVQNPRNKEWGLAEWYAGTTGATAE